MNTENEFEGTYVFYKFGNFKLVYFAQCLKGYG